MKLGKSKSILLVTIVANFILTIGSTFAEVQKGYNRDRQSFANHLDKLLTKHARNA